MKRICLSIALASFILGGCPHLRVGQHGHGKGAPPGQERREGGEPPGLERREGGLPPGQQKKVDGCQAASKDGCEKKKSKKH